MKNINVKAFREELAQVLSRKFDDSHGVAIYGAGDTAERIVVPFMEEIEVSRNLIRFFIDDTPSKQGTFFHGKPVITLEKARTVCKGLPVLICSAVPQSRDIMERTLRSHLIEGSEYGIWDEYVLCKHMQEVLAVFDMLEDDFSKETYANILLFRMKKAQQNFALVQRDHQYFALPEFMKDLYYQEVFVDCGAFIGDTIENYLKERGGVFQKIYAFEPNNSIYEALSVRMERIRREWNIPEGKIELIHAGIGEKECQIQDPADMKETPDDSRFVILNQAEVEKGGIQICSIDGYFANNSISFLKADIEGFENQMLYGAEYVIRRDQPKMAICLYHSPFDMYRIALKIKELCPSYKFAIRQHAYTINETVLYAYI